MRPRRVIWLAHLVFGALALGSIAGAPPASAADVGDGSATVEVSITDSGFHPPAVQVAPGTTVLWTNDGAEAHALASSTGLFESDPLLPGDSYLFSFDAEGTYEYASGSLLGRVTVGDAVDVAGARAAVPAAAESGSPSSVGGAPQATPVASPEGLAFTGAAESAVLTMLGVAIVLLGWSLLAGLGVSHVVEPWRGLGLLDTRRLGFTDELLPRGLWRRRPRGTTQANLLPASERRAARR